MKPDQSAGQEITWHTLESNKALALLEVGEKAGLSEEQTLQRLKTYGPNELPAEKATSALIRFLRQFHNILIYLLIGAAVVTALLDHWIDTFVIIGVVLVNAMVGYVQEGKAEQALAQLRKILSPKATVIRQGKRIELDASQLVPGDIVLLQSGDRVPADLRLLQAQNLRIDEAMLTGESQPSEKQTDTTGSQASLGDRTNMAFSGTLVTYGRGKGLVTGTGMNTEIGKIRELIASVDQLTTPLLRKMDRFAKWLSVFIIVMAGVILAVAWLSHTTFDLSNLFLAVIALAVAAIPEGLPAIMTITLALGVRKMVARNAIVRKLPAVETLGSVNVICTDKTGTLTRNEMMVTQIGLPDSSIDVTGSGYSPEGAFTGGDKRISSNDDKALTKLCRCAFFCNDADISQNENNEWVLTGDPTEGALKTLGYKAGLDPNHGERIASIPFESENKYMAVLHRFADQDEYVILVKGAAERILSFCHLDPEVEQEWKTRMDELASSGLRIMGFAQKSVDPGQKQLQESDFSTGLEFLGITGIIDPPREEAVKAIKSCKEAGILIKMITGDHAITASAIGHQIGIAHSEKTVTGEELNKLANDEAWENIAMEYNIFARTNPEHKLNLVKALQRRGKVVAMTGDGVNDAPALKRADVGVAMGIKGTEVTKNAAEMVLADDNFLSIANAVEEGRTIYNNLRKAILFILPTNGAEALLVISSILVGFTLPITPVQVLWVNMVTAVTLALALAFEPPEKNIMKLPPRKSDEPVVGGYFIWRIVFVSSLVAGFSLLFFFIYNEVAGVEFARTIALNTLVAGQVFYLFNSRYLYLSNLSVEGLFGNSKVLVAGAVLLILQLSLTYLPWMQNWFDTRALSLYHWGILSLAGFTVFLLVEGEKWFYRKFFLKEHQPETE